MASVDVPHAADTNAASPRTVRLLDAMEQHSQTLSACSRLNPSHCLRQVLGKQRPAPIVKRWLTSQHVSQDASDLRATHGELIRDQYWRPPTTPATTGFYVRRLATAAWFAQLVLEHASGSYPCMHMDSSNSKSNINNNHARLEAGNATQMVVGLVQCVAKAISSVCVFNKDEFSHSTDATSSQVKGEPTMDLTRSDPSGVASFAIGVMLRGIQPYVATRPALLSPLWKGICDMAAPLTCMKNPELAEETLQALLSYLLEGTKQVALGGAPTSTQQQNQNQTQQEFHAKVLVFLVARLTTFMPLYLRSRTHSSRLLVDLWDCVCQLRALGTLSNRYQSLEHKIDQFVLRTVYCHTETYESGCTLENESLSALLYPNRKLPLATTINQEANHTLGKAMILRFLLEQTVTRNAIVEAKDCEWIVSMCEELVFFALPRCHAHMRNPRGMSDSFSTLLLDVPNLVCSSLLQIAVSGGVGAPTVPRQSIVEHLLIRWLAPTGQAAKHQVLHPVTRELVLSIATLYVFRSFDTDSSGSDSPRSVKVVEPDQSGARDSSSDVPPVLAMVVKLVFDSRTCFEHRRNLTGVLLRLANLRPPPQHMRSAIARCVGAAFIERWHVDCKVHRRKRKRSSGERVPDASRGFSGYGMEDLLTLMELLVKTGGTDATLISSSLSGLFRVMAEDNAGLFDPKSTKGVSLYQQSPEALALVLSTLSGFLDDKSKGNQSNRTVFQRRTGLNPDVFLGSLTLWLSERWNRNRKSGRGRLGRGLSTVTVASLRFVSHFLATADITLSADVLGRLQKLLLCCTQEAIDMRLRHHSDPDQQKHSNALLFEVVALLPAMANAVQSDGAISSLERVASTFKDMLDSRSWPIVVVAMTSLVEFAARIPSAHRHVLPRCVTAEAQGLLQCRLQRKVYEKESTETQEDQEDSPVSTDNLLRLIPSELESRVGLFSTSATQVIAPGSYYLTMPTTNGRSALVVFAPGDESLEDIRYMLGSDDLSDVDIRRLRQARLKQDGRGLCLRSTAL